MVKTYLMNTDCLSNDVIFEEELRKMPEYRKDKIQRFKFRKDKNLCLGVGILLGRGMLEAGISAGSIWEEMNGVAIGENGKPFLPRHEDIHFSLSHSGKYAMASFADTEVGCDIEEISPVNMEIAKRFFCAAEYEQIAGCEGEQQKRESFYRLWTLKESYMKLTGLGMKLHLNGFEIVTTQPIIAMQSGYKKAVNFHEFDIPGYKAAVCCHDNNGSSGSNDSNDSHDSNDNNNRTPRNRNRESTSAKFQKIVEITL